MPAAQLPFTLDRSKFDCTDEEWDCAHAVIREGFLRTDSPWDRLSVKLEKYLPPRSPMALCDGQGNLSSHADDASQAREVWLSLGAYKVVAHAIQASQQFPPQRSR